MAIKTHCPHCAFAYSAPDAMAGRTVRCRNCGQTFPLPGVLEAQPQGDAPQSLSSQIDDQFANIPPVEPPPPTDRVLAETKVMPPITTSESNMTGGVGSAKSYMDRTGDPGLFDIAADGSGGVFRPSVPFHFPYATDLDNWLPRLVPLVMVAWLAYVLWAWRPALEESVKRPWWSGAFPVALSLILLQLVWWPTFSALIHKIAQNLRFALPSRSAMRSLAVGSLPFAFAGLFWIAGESLVTLVIGLLIGAALAVPAAWFLFRLRQNELVHAGVGIAFASVFAAAISVGAFLGVNIGINQALANLNKVSMFASSPLGPGFAWDLSMSNANAPSRAAVPRSPGAALPVVPATPAARPTATPTSPTVVPETRPPQDLTPPLTNPGTPAAVIPPLPRVTPVPSPTPMPAVQPQVVSFLADNPYLGNARYLPIASPIQQVVYPFCGSCNVFAVMRPAMTGGDNEITVYQIAPFGPVPGSSSLFSASLAGAGYALSPSGDQVARVVRFGGQTSIDIYSFKHRLSDNQPLPGGMGFGEQPARLAGFLDENTLLCQYPEPDLEIWGYSQMTPKDPWSLYVLAGGRFSSLLSSMPQDKAFSTLVVYGSQPKSGVPSIQYWTRASRPITAGKPTPPVLKGLIPLHALRNLEVEPAGLVAWHDDESKVGERDKVAVIFQDGTAVRLFVFLAPDAAHPEGHPVASVTLPGGFDPIPMGMMPRKNRLVWLRDSLLLYGNHLIDFEKRDMVSKLPTTVVDARVVGDGLVHLVVSQPQEGLKIIEAQIK